MHRFTDFQGVFACHRDSVVVTFDIWQEAEVPPRVRRRRRKLTIAVGANYLAAGALTRQICGVVQNRVPLSRATSRVDESG